MPNQNQSKNVIRPKLNDSSLGDLTRSGGSSSYTFQLESEYDVSTQGTFKVKKRLNYDKMELNQHLIELWTVLRKVAKGIFLTTLITLVMPGFRNGHLAINPYHPMILQLLNAIIRYSLTSLSAGGDVQVFIGSPLAPITFYLNLGAFVAIVISLPLTVKELMNFIRPGLTEQEYEILKYASKISLGLFLLGASISYFIIIPVTLKILVLSAGVVGEGEVLQLYSISSVLNLLLWGTLGGGLLYASPVILLVLVNIDVITPEDIANRRREIIFGIFAIAAFVTPDPTIISMLILSLPMIVILEFIISASYRIELEKILRY